MIEPRHQPSLRRGLTLFEMVIALALVAALIGSMFTFWFDLLGIREQSGRFARHQHAAAMLIESIESDLRCCLVGDSVSGPGVAGEAANLRVLSRSVPLFLAERGADDPQVLADLQRTEYRFLEGQGLVARRTIVVAPESPAGDFAPLSEDLGRVRFRFLDGATWRDAFDSLEAGRLPAAVEVAVWFEAPAVREPAPERAPDGPGFLEQGPSLNPLLDRATEEEAGVPPPDRVRRIAILDPAPGPEEAP